MLRPSRPLIAGVYLFTLAAAVGVGACAGEEDDAGDEAGSPDLVGSVCELPEDCYPGVDPADLSGDVECLDRVPEGYCTHHCESDADCCAVEGECETDLPQVCSPFESTGLNLCFLSCEAEDVMAAGAEDDGAFCQDNVSPFFVCRSSGGGSDNKKICVPANCGLGAACGEDADCGGGDLVCIGGIDGGYCGVLDCAGNADCPADSSCVEREGGNYCAKNCAAESDCTLCRPGDEPVACTGDVTFVEAGNTVCVVG